MKRKERWFWVGILQMTVAKAHSRDLSAMTEIWENLKIVKAADAARAYRKAVKIGKTEAGDCRGTLRLWGKPAITKFLGVSSMGLIHDDLADGAEITWTLYHKRMSNALKLVTPKDEVLAAVNKELSYLRDLA